MYNEEVSILLTGASGFAGAHMLKVLIENGYTSIFCPVTYSHGGNPYRLKSLISLEKLKHIQFLEIDLALETLDLSTYGIELIINFASESNVDNSIVSPSSFVNNNISLMVNLLEAIRNTNYPIPLIHISTDEVYGEIPEKKRNFEWDLPLRPSNPYSASKASQEELIFAYCRTFGLCSLVLNITNMIGETQNIEKFVPRVISRIHNSKAINIDTNLNGAIGTRKYIYVRDVVDAVLLLLVKFKDFKSGLIDRYHIGGNKSYSNLEIVRLISEILGREPILSFSPSPRPGYDLEYNLDTDKIRSMGWNQSKSVPDALSNIVNWTMKNPQWLENPN